MTFEWKVWLHLPPIDIILSAERWGHKRTKWCDELEVVCILHSCIHDATRRSYLGRLDDHSQSF